MTLWNLSSTTQQPNMEAMPQPVTTPRGGPKPVLSNVQAEEKRRNAEKARRRTQKRQEEKRLEKFKKTCPRTERAKIGPRSFVLRKTKEDAACAACVRLVNKLKKPPVDFKKQNDILMQSGNIRWREHRTISFDPPAGEPPRHERHFVVEIIPNASRSSSTTVWKALLEVKGSRLKTKLPGLGLFACRCFKVDDVISLHAGASFDPGKSFVGVLCLPQGRSSRHFTVPQSSVT